MLYVYLHILTSELSSPIIWEGGGEFYGLLFDLEFGFQWWLHYVELPSDVHMITSSGTRTEKPRPFDAAHLFHFELNVEVMCLWLHRTQLWSVCSCG